MRALAIAGRGSAPMVQDVPLAEPGAGQVRVAIGAASVNGIDAAVAAGYLWDAMPHEFPVVLGRDFAGTVDEVGRGVSGIEVGERVCGVITAMALGAGSIAEAVTVDAGTVVAVPPKVSSEHAAAAGLAAVTALDLASALGITSDDVVLVAGATGGVGAFAVQLAAATGAKVLATARPGEASEFVRSLGAAEIVDYTGDLESAVRTSTPVGVDAVVHAAGEVAPLASLLRADGRLASALGASGEQVARDDVTVTPVMAVATPDKLRSLLDAVASGTLRVPVGKRYTLDQSPQAIIDFASHKLGKLVVAVG